MLLGLLSRVLLFATPWTVAHQAPLSMGFSRQEYCSGLPCPPPGDLPDPVMEPASLTFPALASRIFTTEPGWKGPVKPPGPLQNEPGDPPSCTHQNLALACECIAQKRAFLQSVHPKRKLFCRQGPQGSAKASFLREVAQCSGQGKGMQVMQ